MRKTAVDLVCVFGTGRNGSTLVSKLLDGLPGLYVHGSEINFLAAWSDLQTIGWVRPHVFVNVSLHPLVDKFQPLPIEMLYENFVYHTNVIRELMGKAGMTPPSDVDPWDQLRKQSHYTVDEFIPAYLAAHAAWTEPDTEHRMLAFKTIEVQYIADYEKVFPEMRQIHLIRDPVKTYSSAKRTLINKGGTYQHPYTGTGELAAFIDYRWVPHARTIIERKRREEKKDTFCLVRYEDVCDDVVLHFAKPLAEFLSMPEGCETIMSRQSSFGGASDVVNTSTSSPSVESPKEVSSTINKEYSSEVVTAREQAYIAFRVAPYARDLGYDIPPKLGRMACLVAWCVPHAEEFRNMPNWRARLLAITDFIRQRGRVVRATLLTASSRDK